MNRFEEYTAIIGGIAVLIEAIKHLKRKFKSWFKHA